MDFPSIYVYVWPEKYFLNEKKEFFEIDVLAKFHTYRHMQAFAL